MDKKKEKYIRKKAEPDEVESDLISFDLVDAKTIKRRIEEGDVRTPFMRTKKYLDIPKDQRWNTKQLNSKLLAGILNGDSIPKIATSLQDVIGNNSAAATRNARTIITGAENAGRKDSYEELEEQGVIQKKVWIATPDDRTRESHLLMDGEEVDIDEPFSNGLMYPADPSGDASEVYNCRCTMRTHIIGFRKADGRIEKVGQRDDIGHEAAIAKEEAKREAEAEAKRQEQEAREAENEAKRRQEEERREEIDKQEEKIKVDSMPELKEKTLKKIDDYIEGSGGNNFTKEEVQEIKEHMTITSEPLFRIEDMSWMGENLEVGSTFSFDKPLKSFTQDYSALKTIVAEGDDAGLYEDTTVALFKTIDETSHLDISRFSRNHAEEMESLVGGEFEIVDEEDGEIINGYHTWIFYIRQIKK